MKKTKFAAFLAGVLVAVLVMALALPTFAVLSGKQVTIYPGVNIYMDDVLLNPTDANGNPVEVFIYNGTTYLPVRAISEALDKVVQWEGDTSSVFIGKHTGEKPADWLFDLDYFDYGGTWGRNYILTDNLGVEHEHTYRGHKYSDKEAFFKNDENYMTFKLNAQYTRLTGVAFQRYEARASEGTTTFRIYGDGELLWSGSTGRGVDPKEFNIDITGVLQLTVKASVTDGTYGYGCLGEVGLWT